MKKRILFLALALILCLGLVPTAAGAAEDDFIVIGKNHVFDRYTGPGGEVVIPDTVTEIASGVFKDRTDITSVVIPDTVTKIHENVFYNSGLTSVVIPGSVAWISDSAFARCGELAEVTIEEGVTTLYGACFGNCDKFTHVTIPDSVTYVGNVFQYCDNLESVTIGQGVEEISDKAFYQCPSLTSLTIENPDFTLPENGFRGCPNLTLVTVGGDEGWLTTEDGRQKADQTAGTVSDAPSEPVYTGKGIPAAAAAEPVQSRNVGNQEQRYSQWSAPMTSYLCEGKDYLTRVERVDDKVIVEEYDDDFYITNRRELEMELPLWGGFYAGESYNFLFFGQENTEESNSKEVIRVVKYSKNWQRLDEASLKGINTIDPFHYGSLRCAEYNGMLYVRTCHRMYTNPSDGLNHQSNMTLAIRQSDMKVTDSHYLVSYTSIGYVSHSFNQFILVDSDRNVVTLDHGDAYPRSLVLMRWANQAGSRTTGSKVTELDVVTFSGATGENATGCSVGGLEETSSGYVYAYNYDPTDINSTVRDVYLGYVPKGFTSSTRPKAVKLTVSGTKNSTPQLVATSLNGGYILWTETDENNTGTLCYAPYSAGGSVGTVTRVRHAYLSDCKPVIHNGKVTWYVTGDRHGSTYPAFYTLDGSGLSKTIPYVDVSDASDWAQEEMAEAFRAGLITETLWYKDWTADITRLEFCSLMVRLVEQSSGQAVDEYLASRGLAVTDPFTDTDNADVLSDYALGIVKGTSETTFNPYGSITRQEAATMLARTARVLGLSAGTAETFADASSFPDWAEDSIDFVSSLTDPTSGKKVMGGIGDNTFAPTGRYSREQAYLTSLRLFHCGG